MAEPKAPLHEEPFPELLGLTSEAVVSDDGTWVAVSSVLSDLSRVAVYRTADLSCAHVLTVAMETETMAFHPTLPLLAIGFDNGDAYMREGRLVLLEPGSGHRVDFADADRGVELVRWRDARTLELTLFAMHDGHEFDRSRAAVTREEWLGLAPDALDMSALDARPLDPYARLPYPDTGPALPLLQGLAERAGRSYDGRGGVRAVAGLSDGRVLATRKHTALECWAPDGSLLWSVPAPSGTGGTRIEVAADERTARVAVPGPDSRTRTDFPLVDTSDGTVLDRPSVPFSAALTARTDGVWAIKDTYDREYGTGDSTPDTRFFAADGTPLGTAHEPDRYELVPVEVHGCPELLFTRRRRHDVIALDPHTAAETPLFAADGPLGEAAYVSDAGGPALVHGGSELIRRTFPAGDVVWRRPLDAVVTALDAHDGVLHALCADGALVSVDAADGTVLDRRPLPPYGLQSLRVAPDGTVLVGTVAGRILRY
ncbi:PQQ-binding-like beta-propeller repeat protein [Streptomyces sp. NK15101]|uniref:PQQ-binding-like beta-propeller repeat protein n=1 Tax=Streptomyces sp. NK15101 TaxID=2873261 RepID=UPI001CEDDB4D|nr:PQQ-binding-like beta-propeller repeat protein [Streptomyces sp. NK15101]